MAELVDALGQGLVFIGRGSSSLPYELLPFYECPFLHNLLQLLIPQLFTHIPLFLQSVSKIQFFFPKKTDKFIS